MADWNLPPLIGIGTDLDVDLLDEFADFIPVFDNECNENNEYEPIEVMIGKIDPLAVAAHPDPPIIESQCLERPLLIVQLGWGKAKKGLDLGDPSEYGGEELDTVIPGNPPPAPTGCTLAQTYQIIQGSLGGQRYERGKRSEYQLELFSLPVPGSPKKGIPADSRREHLKRVHKNDKHKNIGLDHEYVSGIGLRTLSYDIGPLDGVNPDEYTYSATYEYDWYAKNRNIRFTSFNGYLPELRLRRKGDHEHYQVICMPPPDWCEFEVRAFTFKTGHAIVLAKP